MCAVLALVGKINKGVTEDEHTMYVVSQGVLTYKYEEDTRLFVLLREKR